jgi:phosphohistidine phosphatase
MRITRREFVGGAIPTYRAFIHGKHVYWKAENSERRPFFQNRKTLKTLLVLRHAKSSWDEPGLDDHERPLNKRGRRDGPSMGALIRTERLTPDIIISSDAVRARTTAEAVAHAAHYGGQIMLSPQLYLAGPDEIVAVLRRVKDTDAGAVLIVGHNPGLERLVALLTGEEERLPTAALARIVLPIERWRDLDTSTQGFLQGVWRPNR